jgi:hypothetical protein
MVSSSLETSPPSPSILETKMVSRLHVFPYTDHLAEVARHLAPFISTPMICHSVLFSQIKQRTPALAGQVGRQQTLSTQGWMCGFLSPQGAL